MGFGPFRNRRLIEAIESLQADLTASPPEFRIGTQVELAASSNVASVGLFAISGLVMVTGIIGEVTTVVQSQANAIKLTYDPTGAGADTDLCATVEANAAAVGSRLHITGTLATAMVKGVRMGLWQATSFVLETGGIKLVAAATSTGAIKWRLWYHPLTTGSQVGADEAGPGLQT